LFIFATNLIGLIFTGMEHPLQILFVMLIAYFMLYGKGDNKSENWLVLFTVTAPLIRYENLAISFVAILFMLLYRKYKKAILSAAIIVLTMGLFSVFLMTMGLKALPSSVLAKSSVLSHDTLFMPFARNIGRTLLFPRGIIIALSFVSYVLFMLFRQLDKDRMRIMSVTSVGLVLHMLFGTYGWYNRYEIYIWTFFIMMSIHLIAPSIVTLVKSRKNNSYKIMLFAVMITTASCTQYVHDLYSLPVGSNNIYEQQYQMHRYVVDYYKKPVAVNDIGYVSYKNDNYVLDLLGLSSPEALELIAQKADVDWMNRLAKSKGVELAILYDSWVSHPPEWEKVGELILGHERITVGGDTVSFYLIEPQAKEYVKTTLDDFVKTLPESVSFVFY